MTESKTTNGLVSDDSHLVDRDLVEYVRREGSVTISQMVEFAGVTATAIRQRLTRLMEQGLLQRVSEPAGRGRPTHRYSLTPAGIRTSGNNFEDLAGVLWSEIRAVKDLDVRYGLLRRIVDRLAEIYREQLRGDSLQERMQSLASLMREREIPFDVVTPDGAQLPILTALACPYPGLVEQDRTVCSMEKMLFAEILGDGLRLTSCRLDGSTHCTFEMSAAGAQAV